MRRSVQKKMPYYRDLLFSQSGNEKKAKPKGNMIPKVPAGVLEYSLLPEPPPPEGWGRKWTCLCFDIIIPENRPSICL